jgi:predicted dehydrogenase
MSRARVKIGVVGCGYVFDHYMATAAAHPELEIAWVWDIDRERLERVASFYALRAAGGLADILDDPEVALVLNLTSIAAHGEVTRAALAAGKHVYCEKPLVTDMDEARSLFALAAEQGRMLMAAPSNLFSDSVQTMWRAVADGAVGRPLLAYAEFDDNPVYLMHPEGWRSRSGAPWPWKHEYEAGCTWEHVGYHLVWLCALFGPVRRLTAFSKVSVPHKSPVPLDPPDTPDFSVAVLDFESGPVARITCSIAAPQDHRMRVIGDEGEIAADTYRHYQAPVRLERFSPLSLNARKALSVRRHPMFGSPMGVGGKKLRLLEFPWSHATRKASQRGSLAPHKALVAAVKRREVGAQDKMLGVALTAMAIADGAPPPLPPGFILHVTELTLAIQAAGPDGATSTPATGFEPLAPLENPVRPLADWRKSHAPGLLDRMSRGPIDRLHRH